MSTKNNHDLVKQQSTKKQKKKQKLYDLNLPKEISKEKAEEYAQVHQNGYLCFEDRICSLYHSDGHYYKQFVCSRFEILKS